MNARHILLLAVAFVRGIPGSQVTGALRECGLHATVWGITADDVWTVEPADASPSTGELLHMAYPETGVSLVQDLCGVLDAPLGVVIGMVDVIVQGPGGRAVVPRTAALLAYLRCGGRPGCVAGAAVD